MLALRLGGLATACAVAAFAIGSVRAAPQAASACPAPKPLPASVKKPPKGASATQLANFLLALPQRKPCDVNLFTSSFPPTPPQFTTPVAGLYPAGRSMKPKSEPVPAEAQVRGQLATFMAGSMGKAAALALFDGARLKSAIPDPTLRASFVALKGTVAEPLMNEFLSRPGMSVRWTTMPRRVQVAAGGATYVAVSSRYQGEHFAQLSGMFAHEILHHDFATPPTEEVLLHVVNTAVHMQLLSRRPELATQGTELARFMNGEVLWFVNSRASGSSKSAIVVPRGRGTAPGSAQSRRDYYAHSRDFSVSGRAAAPEDNAPAPAAFAAVLGRLLAPAVSIPSPPTYSKKTVELFSHMNDTWLSPVDRLRVSVLLGLVSTEEIVRYTGLPRARAIATFKLAPILAVK